VADLQKLENAYLYANQAHRHLEQKESSGK
jgi:hypothetical protein